MVKLKCKRCGRGWNYKGDKKYYASCPECRTSVKIRRVNLPRVKMDKGVAGLGEIELIKKEIRKLKKEIRKK